MNNFNSIDRHEIILEKALKNEGGTDVIKKEQKISVELYKDLDCYFVEYKNDLAPETDKTVSFGRLTQARTIFKDKVKLAKYEKEKYDEKNVLKNQEKQKSSVATKRKIR